MLIADIIDSWVLIDNDSNLKTSKHIETNVDEGVVRAWLEEANESSLEIQRIFSGLTGHFEETGKTRRTFRYDTGNGRLITFFARVPYLCVRDNIHINDHVCGSGVQKQTWIAVSQWKTVPGSYHESQIPTDGSLYN